MSIAIDYRYEVVIIVVEDTGKDIVNCGLSGVRTMGSIREEIMKN